MKIELCVGNYKDALYANQYKVNRIELCANLIAGGLTPSAGTIVKTLKNVNVPCHVLIRPRAGDFNYNTEEIAVMLADIEFCKTVGCAGVVFGVLNNKKRFDLEKNLLLLEAAGEMECTFHRAIDISADYQKDINSIINCGFDRVLTAGTKQNCTEGLQTLKLIKQLTENKIELMVGGGINAQNIANIIKVIKPEAVHFSASNKKTKGNTTLFKAQELALDPRRLATILQAI